MSTSDLDLVIVGAGICGLSLAKALTEAGKRVAIVEGRDRPGGRISTLGHQFSQPVEAGAEFIHGDLPLTKKLAKKAGVSFTTKKGKIYKCENGTITEIKEMIDDYKKVISRLKALSHDMSLSDFIHTELNAPADEQARRSVVRMAEGFDVADPSRISAFAVRDEWKEGTISDPFILKTGYTPLVDYLYRECLAAGCRIYLSQPVTAMHWKKDHVTLDCAGPLQLHCKKAIITVPLGVLTACEGDENYIRFEPPLLRQIEAAAKIGYGPVVKAIFEFKKRFWDDKAFKNILPQMPDPGFFVTNGAFPTWWMHGRDNAIITGWSGGPNAVPLKLLPDETIAREALTILADVFSTTASLLDELLLTYKIVNWGSDPFSKGAYSYDTLESDEARKCLLQPVEETLFFCGEALAEGGLAGTVEAALSSAEQLIRKLT